MSDAAPHVAMRDPLRRDDRVVGVRQRPASPPQTPAPKRRPRRSSVWQWFALAMLGCLLGIVLWAILVRTTVTVVPPLGEARVVPLNDVEFPVVGVGDADAMQIEAVRLEQRVTITEPGEALTEVPMPDGRAAGSIRIINMLEQSIPLPVGTEFIAQGVNGSVRFMLDEPAMIPAAVTTSSLTGRTTTYGDVTVAVTARSAGSDSNVAADTVNTLLLPGQGPITSGSGQLTLRNDAITGGSETVRRIVSESDMARLLGAALSRVYAQALRELTDQAQQRMLQLDEATLTPDPESLGTPAIYGVPTLDPPVGTVLEPQNATVSLVVSVTFRVYAVQADKSVQAQLQSVVPQRFQGGNTPICRVGEIPAFRVDTWQVHDANVRINGEIRCAPQMPIDATVLANLPAQLANMSYTDAQALLDTLQTNGVISSYTLPNRDRMPPLPQLVSVRVSEIAP